MRKVSLWIAAAALLLLPAAGKADHDHDADRFPTKTPVKHLVVIFDENNSFDHYFGTYPVATNPMGEPKFEASPDTPSVNNYQNTLKTGNPDALLNGAYAPFRLDHSQAETCDNDNHYTDEQKAYDGGLLDKFAVLLSGTTVAAPDTEAACIPALSMGYYDGNTVTALWNYAQHFALGDNFFASTFGTTVMGHLNLIAGQTGGAVTSTGAVTNITSGKILVINGSVITNIDPIDDDCSTTASTRMSGLNIGNLLRNAGITWGWFYGDWTPTTPSTGGSKAVCSSEYDAHYAPFQYYQSTANPHHLPPTSVGMIGKLDQANNQYAITDFWNAVDNGNMPAVSFIKPPHVDNGHPSDSMPLLEQTFLVDTINRLMKRPEWDDMAIIITWDDSDGWYDHVMPPIVSPSADPKNDALLGSTGLCGTTPTLTAPAVYVQDRCGYGPRLPFLAISPFARENYVDHKLMDQSSIIRFIEDNWLDGQRIGNQSFDAIAGSIGGMFDFRQGWDFDHDRDRDHSGFDRRLFLNDETGEVVR